MKQILSLDHIRNYPKLPLHTETYFSEALGREQSFGWIVPEEWDGVLGENTKRYPLLVLLHGLNGNYLDWYSHTRIGKYVQRLPMVVVFVEGGNGWYTNGVAEGAERWEDDLVLNLLPHIQQRLPIAPSGKGWGIGGLSMGGYGAMKLALKHSGLFSLAVSHSGSLEKPLTAERHAVFGDPDCDLGFRRRESLHYLIEQALCVYPLERPYLLFDCGLDDPFLEVNRRFRDHLQFLGYGHEYLEMKGHHTWPYWERALRRILPTVADRLGVQCGEDLPISP